MITPRIFWTDTISVYRQQVVKSGSFSKNELAEVYTGIKGHLSVNNRLHGVYSKQQASATNKEFVLFCSPRYKFEINDRIVVDTAGGQHIELYAGQSKNYTATCQVQCSFEPIAEAEKNV